MLVRGGEVHNVDAITQAAIAATQNRRPTRCRLPEGVSLLKLASSRKDTSYCTVGLTNCEVSIAGPVAPDSNINLDKGKGTELLPTYRMWKQLLHGSSQGSTGGSLYQ